MQGLAFLRKIMDDAHHWHCIRHQPTLKCDTHDIHPHTGKLFMHMLFKILFCVNNKMVRLF